MPRTETRGPRWSATDDDMLSTVWGEKTPGAIAKEFGRTLCSVVKRAYKLGLGPAHAHTKNVHQLVRETGYARSRIINAAKRLDIKLHRAKRVSDHKPRMGKHYEDPSRFFRLLVTPNQEKRILEFLARLPDAESLWSNKTRITRVDAWGTGRKPKSCKRCKKTDKPHKARGYCIRCYNSKRMKKKQCTSKERKKK